MGCSSSSNTAGTQGPKGQITLGYWNIRAGARGNGTRYLLAYCGANWVEKRYDPKQSEQWNWMKESGFMSFPNLPYIQDGNFMLSETAAVHQYIADKYKPELLGSNPQETARIKQVYGIAVDKIIDAIKVAFAQED